METLQKHYLVLVSAGITVSRGSMLELQVQQKRNSRGVRNCRLFVVFCVADCFFLDSPTALLSLLLANFICTQLKSFAKHLWMQKVDTRAQKTVSFNHDCLYTQEELVASSICLVLQLTAASVPWRMFFFPSCIRYLCFFASTF